jgi:hypothetical protein
LQDALPARRDSGQPHPPSSRNSADSVASGSAADTGGSNPYAFLFPGEPGAGSAAPPPAADPYAAFATGGTASSSGSQPPNPCATPPASPEPSQVPTARGVPSARAKSEGGGDSNPYAFLVGAPDAAPQVALDPAKSLNSPYASFSSNASAPPATNGASKTRRSTDAAAVAAGSSPPAKAAAGPYDALLGGDAVTAKQNGVGGGGQAAAAVAGLAAAAMQYRANRSASASDVERSTSNPFNNVPADWSEANGGAAKPQVKSVGRLSVSSQGRCVSLLYICRSSGPSAPACTLAACR